jgi:phage tail protein X/outer membrane protein OmpA-like peptidoglycan-associated protein
MSIAEDASAPIVHEIKNGDHIMTISQKYYGTTHKWKYIIDANPGMDPNKLVVGNRINIPILPDTKVDFIVTTKKSAKEEKVAVEEEKLVEKGPSRKIASEAIEVEIFEEKKEVISSEEIKPEIAPIIKKYKKERVKEVTYNENSGYKEKFEILQKEYLKLKIKNQNYLEDLIEYEKKDAQFMSWKKDRQDLMEQISHLEGKLSKTSLQKDTLEEKHPFYVPSMLAYSQEQILKEKNRILTHRFWLQKNKGVGKCELNFPESDSYSETKFQEFIEYLNEQFGSDRVYVEFTDNKLIFQLPGRVVYGVNTPTVSKEYYQTLFDISEYMKHLPVEHIHITGFSRYNKVQSENGATVSGTKFSISQALKIQNFFTNELGWSDSMFTTGTFGFHESNKLRKKKYFDVIVNFKKRDVAGRQIASIPEIDNILSNISKEIFEKLHEPKYSKVELKDKGLDIHMGRHYFFDDSMRLTDEGKQKIKTIMDMFSLANDVKFQIEWVPGSLDKDSSKNQQEAVAGVEKLKKYINKNFDWSKDRIEVSYATRQHRLKYADNPREDRYNRRIIFKVIPLSINIRTFGEPKDD